MRQPRRAVPCWTLDDHHLCLGDALIVSFQRTGQQVGPPAGGSPKSYGALPMAADPRLTPAADLLVPLNDTDALWLGLRAAARDRPVAVRVAIDMPGRRDAVTGGPWTERLASDPQNYVVCPPQIAVDGVQDGAACARQFARRPQSDVAIGCERIELVSMLAARRLFPPAIPAETTRRVHGQSSAAPGGGRAEGPGVPQVIHADPYGLDAWSGDRCTVSIALLSPEEFSALTGAPLLPPRDDADTYGGWRLP